MKTSNNDKIESNKKMLGKTVVYVGTDNPPFTGFVTRVVDDETVTVASTKNGESINVSIFDIRST